MIPGHCLYWQNEIVFKLMKICILVFQLTFCIIIVFYGGFLTKREHLENENCKNGQLTSRHVFPVSLKSVIQKKSNNHSITGSFFFNSNLNRARVHGRLHRVCFEISFFLINGVFEYDKAHPTHQYILIIELNIVLHWICCKGTVWNVSV